MHLTGCGAFGELSVSLKMVCRQKPHPFSPTLGGTNTLLLALPLRAAACYNLHHHFRPGPPHVAATDCCNCWHRSLSSTAQPLLRVPATTPVILSSARPPSRDSCDRLHSAPLRICLPVPCAAPAEQCGSLYHPSFNLLFQLVKTLFCV